MPPVTESAARLTAVLGGHASLGDYLHWLSAATLGNVVDGVVIVNLLNYGQVVGSGHDKERVASTLEETERGATPLLRRRSRAA